MNLPIWLLDKRTSLTIIGLILFAVFLFFPSITPLLPRWLKLNHDLSHGIPTLLIFVFFIWRIDPIKQERSSKKIYWLLCVTLALLSFIWYLFQSVRIELPGALILILVLIVYLAASFSINTAINLLPFIGILIFVVPILSELNDHLISLSSFVVGAWVDLFKLTAVIEGNNILIPSGRIMIADGCSGLRYLSITLLLGYIICLFNGYSVRQSMFTLLCATGLGLLTNWIRIFLLVLIGYHTDMQSSLMHDHETFGWILFMIILMPAIYWAPIVRKHITFAIKISDCKPLIPSFFLAIGPILFFTNIHIESSHNNLSLNGLTIAEVSGKTESSIPINIPFDAEKSTRFFFLDDVTIQADLAKYTPPSASEKLVPYIQNLLPKEDWVVINQPPEISFANFELTVLKQINSTQKKLLLHQFNVGSSATGSYRFAKLLQLKAKFLGENFFGVLTLQSSCKTDCMTEMNAFKKISENWQLHKFNAP